MNKNNLRPDLADIIEELEMPIIADPGEGN
jgi:hypothetical protein